MKEIKTANATIVPHVFTPNSTYSKESRSATTLMIPLSCHLPRHKFTSVMCGRTASFGCHDRSPPPSPPPLCSAHLLPSSRFSHSTSNVMVSSVSMSNEPLATPVLPAAVTRIGRDMPCQRWCVRKSRDCGNFRAQRHALQLPRAGPMRWRLSTRITEKSDSETPGKYAARVLL